MTPAHYARVWLASMRYSLTRQMMFRVDFLVWLATDLVWMVVNFLLIEVVYGHIDSLAGWTKHEMMLLMGVSLMQMRLFTGLFLSNLYEFGRNVRSGNFDFHLAQPGRVLFMISTRKLELEGVLNFFLSGAVTVWAAGKVGLQPDAATLAAFAVAFVCAMALHYSVLLILASSVFWVIKSEGVENGYFTLMEFSRLPAHAYRGITNVVFVWALPVVVVTFVPVQLLRSGVDWTLLGWIAAAAVVWFSLAVWVFERGLQRYASASS